MDSRQLLGVVLAEDDPDDQVLMKDAFKESGIKCNVQIVDNGQALLNRLLQTDLEKPDLILLDLNMPIMDGRQALKEIRQHPRFQSTPVVVLTTSSAQEDVDICYKLGANSYITKPESLEELVEILKVLSSYWCKLVRLPSAVLEN